MRSSILVSIHPLAVFTKDFGVKKSIQPSKIVVFTRKWFYVSEISLISPPEVDPNTPKVPQMSVFPLKVTSATYFNPFCPQTTYKYS